MKLGLLMGRFFSNDKLAELMDTGKLAQASLRDGNAAIPLPVWESVSE